MSLTFGAATSDRVHFGSPAILDNVAPFTLLLWIYPTTFTSLRMLWHKGGSGTGKWLRLNGTVGDVELVSARSSTAATYITNSAPLVLNRWNCLAVTCDLSATPVLHIYRGDLANPLVEATYGTATNGAGINSDDSTLDYVVGNRAVSAFNTAFQGRIALVIAWKRALTLRELCQQQFNPRPTANCVLYSVFGRNGIDVQSDASGNANQGIVTGATVSPHPPFGPVVGMLGFEQPDWLRGRLKLPGTLFTQALTGGLSFSGGLSRKLLAKKAITGGLSFAGGLSRKTQKKLTGAISPQGALTRKTSHKLTGALNFTGQLQESFHTKQAIAGVLSFSGLLSAVKVIVGTAKRSWLALYVHLVKSR